MSEREPPAGVVASLKPFSGKVALVTGSTSGIGEASAKTLAARGAKVVVAGRREDAGRRIAAEIGAAGGEATFVRCDVSEESQVTDLVAATLSTYGALDIGINNAGAALEMLPVAESTTAQFEAMHRLNVMGVFWAMQAEIREMLAGGGGTIVNVSSVNGLDGLASAGTYAATKHAVIGLTKSAALDYAGQGIRINAIAPGPTLTAPLEADMKAGKHTEADIVSAVPLGRLADPQEIANGIAWLAGPEASFVVGETVTVDGGLHAR